MARYWIHSAWMVLWLLGVGSACELIAPLDSLEERDSAKADDDADQPAEDSPSAGDKDSPPADGPDDSADEGPDDPAGDPGDPAYDPGELASRCMPNCNGLFCDEDGCGGFCSCPEGTACDPDMLTCEDATCYQGVDVLCEAVETEAYRRKLLDGAPHCYESVVDNDGYCTTNYAVHFHCTECAGIDEDGNMPLCWARCLCDDELAGLDGGRHCVP